MPFIDMSPEKAEEELLMLIRLQDSQSFNLTVTTADGRWTVTSEDLDAGTRAIGEGDSFAEAWFRQDPAWARK